MFGMKRFSKNVGLFLLMYVWNEEVL